MIPKIHSVHSPPFLQVGGVEPPTKFSKEGGGLNMTSTLKGEFLGKRGMTFFREGRGLQFLHKK